MQQVCRLWLSFCGNRDTAGHSRNDGIDHIRGWLSGNVCTRWHGLHTLFACTPAKVGLVVQAGRLAQIIVAFEAVRAVVAATE